MALRIPLTGDGYRPQPSEAPARRSAATAPSPCEHPAHALHYLGVRGWTGGPGKVHAAECRRDRGGCGDTVALARVGGRR